MQHFPIFLAVAGRRIVVSGGGETALAKLRLLLKTEAHITVFAPDAFPTSSASPPMAASALSAARSTTATRSAPPSSTPPTMTRPRMPASRPSPARMAPSSTSSTT